MFTRIQPGVLAIPSPEYKEINGRQYSVAPLLGQFVAIRARDYAERIYELAAADMAQSKVAQALVPGKLERQQRCKIAYNPKDDKKIDAFSSRIAARAARTGGFVLAIGIFDNHTANPHAPSAMVGYTELSLTTGHTGIADTYARIKRPDTVVPSLGEGVLLDPRAVADEQPLVDWVVPYALRSVNPDDIGIKYADGLLLETSQEALDIDATWLAPYGEYVVVPSKRTSILGETPVTVQFDSLKTIVKTT